MARQSFLSAGVGERLLAPKLAILSGTGSRRPSSALTLLTGGRTDGSRAPGPTVLARPDRRTEQQVAPRTVYLAEQHLRDLDHIIDLWATREPRRRLNRSAVLRRAIEHLRTLVESETDPHPCPTF